MQEKIIILDFGSQTTQLIGRRVRELDTYCEIVPYNKFPKEDPSVKGVILSGSPFSVYDDAAFKVNMEDVITSYSIHYTKLYESTIRSKAFSLFDELLMMPNRFPAKCFA